MKNKLKEKNVYLAMSADIIHIGHLNIIKEAARHGNLTVGILTDKAIASYKRLPFLPYETRSKTVESIKGVRAVISQDTLDYTHNLLKLKPDYVVHGDDWKTGVQSKVREKVINTLKDWGGELIEPSYTDGISSTMLNASLKDIGTTPNVRLSKLRRLINAKSIVRILESHSGLTGLIIEKTSYLNEKGINEEFDGMWSSSLTDSTSKGKPDIEQVDLTTRLQCINDMLESTTKPMIYDGDTGGKPEHFQFTVRTLERLGISAIIIEDKTGLKKNSLFGTAVPQTRDTIEDFSNKIRMGKSAQITDDFMIIARIESFILGDTLEDAIERANAYVLAGADGVMIHSKDKSGDDIKSFCLSFREKNTTTPIVVVPSSYNHIKEEELIEWGANIVIYANHLLRASFPSMQNVAKTILKNKRTSELDNTCMSIKEILELIPGTK
ncbi:phosphoenolpyruvate mutase [Flavobacteriaceae bacterium]|nr:phosphoenolpyruvate mutase [Flavobacteriaceae bacterium]